MRCCKCVDGTYLSKRCNEYQEFPVELKKETVTPRWKEVTLHYQNQRITIGGHVPLAEMFAYSNELRSATQGKAEYTMEFERYAPVPRNIQETLMTKYKDRPKG